MSDGARVRVHLDDDIHFEMPLDVPVMVSALASRCAWTIRTGVPVRIKRVDPADIQAFRTHGYTPDDVYVSGGRVRSRIRHRIAGKTFEDYAVGAAVELLASSGCMSHHAWVPPEFTVREDERPAISGRGVYGDFTGVAVASLAADAGLLVHDGRHVYRAWRNGPLFNPNRGMQEPLDPHWQPAYAAGRSEEHYRWCVAVNGSASHSASDAMAASEKRIDPILLDASQGNGDIVHFMERVPIELLGEWAALRRGTRDPMRDALRDLAAHGMARALTGRDRLADLTLIREAASTLSHGRRAPRTAERARDILAWCEAVAIPRLAEAPIPEDDIEAVSWLTP